jgi:O-antigen/teichoic acid export membrane protein
MLLCSAGNASQANQELVLRVSNVWGSMARHLTQSRSLRAAIIFAAGGFGFAAGNIVLAMVLPAAQFGVVALALALNQFSLTIGTFGMEVIVNRHRPRVDRVFTGYLFGVATATSVVLTLAAGYYYRLTATLTLLLFVMVVASTINKVIAAIFQEDGRIGGSLLLLQIHNYTLLVTAGLIVPLAKLGAPVVVGVVGLGYACTATWGWWQVRRTMSGPRAPISVGLLLREGVAIVGLSVAVQTLFQFERLAIPKVGSMEMLATYAVLAAIAGSAYRMIQLGNSFTLLPRMRAAPDVSAAHAVIRSESITAVIAAVASTLIVIAAKPLVFHYLLRDKYVVGWELIAVMISIGLTRVWEGFSSTIVSALGTATRMAQLSAVSWLSLAIALAGAIGGRGYGLFGILCGMLVAWLTLAGAGTWLALRSFKDRFVVNASAHS